MTEPWGITWHVELADAEDVAYAAKDGRTIREGEELWRIAKAIGPLEVDQSHWGGAHIRASREDVRLASAAPLLAAALRAALDGDPDWTAKAEAAFATVEAPDPAPNAIDDFM